MQCVPRCAPFPSAQISCCKYRYTKSVEGPHVISVRQFAQQFEENVVSPKRAAFWSFYPGRSLSIVQVHPSVLFSFFPVPAAWTLLYEHDWLWLALRYPKTGWAVIEKLQSLVQSSACLKGERYEAFIRISWSLYIPVGSTVFIMFLAFSDDGC